MQPTCILRWRGGSRETGQTVRRKSQSVSPEKRLQQTSKQRWQGCSSQKVKNIQLIIWDYFAISLPVLHEALLLNCQGIVRSFESSWDKQWWSKILCKFHHNDLIWQRGGGGGGIWFSLITCTVLKGWLQHIVSVKEFKYSQMMIGKTWLGPPLVILMIS